MIRRYTLIAVAALGLLPLIQRTSWAQSPREAAIKPLPLVSPIFGDDMVLQRGKANTIWGWTDPGETVRVEIADRENRGQGKPGTDGTYSYVSSRFRKTFRRPDRFLSVFYPVPF
jgi:sialate O-acetylesterase